MEHAHRIRQEFVNDRRYYVLILILMEHAQRVQKVESDEPEIEWVLILILMEHAQRVKFFINLKLICFMVLILVLMEDSQRVYS